MNHEKLECYQGLMRTADGVAKMIAKWPKGYSYLSDQLKRAIISAVLNLCEGNGKRAYTAERRRFFAISLGSICESMAALDLARTFGLISSERYDQLRSELKLAYVKINALP